MSLKLKAALAVAMFLGIASIDGQAAENADQGIGPISNLKLEALEAKLAAKGKELFSTKCSACHKIEERYVGPKLLGVTQRRTPEWIMNMMLNPAEMLEKNDTAKELLGEFLVPMTFQNISKDEARAILEYFRSEDANPSSKSADLGKPADKKSNVKTRKKETK